MRITIHVEDADDAVLACQAIGDTHRQGGVTALHLFGEPLRVRVYVHPTPAGYSARVERVQPEVRPA